jgi:serine/threonine protein phosphatase PrpC
MTIEANSDPHFVIEADMAEGKAVPFLLGEVVVFSSKSPARKTANEDSAAVIPYNATSGILVVADGLGGHPDGDAASRVAVKTMARTLGR